MTVGIVTDSSCDLSEDDIAGLNIEIVPLFIRFGSEELSDRTQITVEEFYRKMASSEHLPQTAAPAPGHFGAGVSPPPGCRLQHCRVHKYLIFNLSHNASCHASSCRRRLQGCRQSGGQQIGHSRTRHTRGWKQPAWPLMEQAPTKLSHRSTTRHSEPECSAHSTRWKTSNEVGGSEERKPCWALCYPSSRS